MLKHAKLVIFLILTIAQTQAIDNQIDISALTIPQIKSDIQRPFKHEMQHAYFYLVTDCVKHVVNTCLSPR